MVGGKPAGVELHDPGVQEKEILCSKLNKKFKNSYQQEFVQGKDPAFREILLILRKILC